MGVLGKIDWIWLGVGILFAMFVLPMITKMLGNLKGSSTAQRATAA